MYLSFGIDAWWTLVNRAPRAVMAGLGLIPVGGGKAWAPTEEVTPKHERRGLRYGRPAKHPSSATGGFGDASPRNGAGRQRLL